MPSLDPKKLTTRFHEPSHPTGPRLPRCYTLTHSDRTGELTLTIGQEIDQEQISGWYTRWMRDEVVAAWEYQEEWVLHVHCHVSGGIVFGSARWRAQILRYHMPQVLQAFRFGDDKFLQQFPDLDHAQVLVHFQARQDSLNTVENYGNLGDYRLLQDHPHES